MRQFLHLLVVDRTCRAALIQAFEGRWILPVIACSERARAPLVAARWLADRQLTGVVAGQWLGRIATDERSIDWLMAITTDTPLHPPSFDCASLDGLEAATAMLEYQMWALEHIGTAGELGVNGPFGSVDWIDDARSWIQSVGPTNLSSPTCFRASANDVVLGLRIGSADVYFKGAAADRASDLLAMVLVARAFPMSFPRTLGLDERSDYTTWLQEGCTGVPLARVHDNDEAVRVASDIGCLQRKAARESLETRIACLNLADVLHDAECLLERAGLPPLSSTAHGAFGDVMSLPVGWTPLDLDPSNVFVDEQQIRYIDLDPRLTAMPIALSIFARRLGATGELLEGLRGAYESRTGEVIPWPSVDLVSELVEVTTGWRRLLRNVERGEVSGPLDRVARAAATRLASARPLV